MERSHSTKRKRDDSIASQIVEDLEGRETDDLGPDIKVWKEKLIKKARLAVEDPALDQGDLSDRWEMLVKLIDSSLSARSTADEHASRTKTLEAAQRELHEFKFLMDIGDWVGNLHNAVRSIERSQLSEIQRLYQERLKRTGMTGAAANTEWEKCKFFRAANGHRASETYEYVAAEVHKVKTWRSEGGPEPETPYLDRIKYLCTEAGVPRARYLDALRYSNDRNVTAHHPPPTLDDHIREATRDPSDTRKTPVYEVDWDSVWKACKDKKNAIRKSFRNDELTEAQLNGFLNTIDTWFRRLVSSWEEEGDAILTANGQEQANLAIDSHAKRVKRRAAAVTTPISFYEEGKWDDIESED